MRMMTYNIRHGLGMDGVLDLERIARVITREAPDIVAIQEIDRFWSRSGGVDQPKHLARLVDMHWAFAPNLEMPPEHPATVPAHYGVAIMSRMPLVASRHVRYPVVGEWEPRGLLEVEVEYAPGRVVSVFCTHFQVDSAHDVPTTLAQRTEQVAILNAQAKGAGEFVVMMGDFNAEPDSPELAPLLGDDSGWQDAWSVAGGGDAGFTIPAAPDREAERRIDYIIVTGGQHISRCEVRVTEETRLASDHFPVIAEIGPDIA